MSLESSEKSKKGDVKKNTSKQVHKIIWPADQSEMKYTMEGLRNIISDLESQIEGERICFCRVIKN